MTYWIIVNVGCIECGGETIIRGVYKSRGEAETEFLTIAGTLGVKHWQQAKSALLKAVSVPFESDITCTSGIGYFKNKVGYALELHRFEVEE